MKQQDYSKWKRISSNKKKTLWETASADTKEHFNKEQTPTGDGKEEIDANLKKTRREEIRLHHSATKKQIEKAKTWLVNKTLSKTYQSLIETIMKPYYNLIKPYQKHSKALLKPYWNHIKTY